MLSILETEIKKGIAPTGGEGQDVMGIEAPRNRDAGQRQHSLKIAACTMHGNSRVGNRNFRNFSSRDECPRGLRRRLRYARRSMEEIGMHPLVLPVLALEAKAEAKAQRAHTNR